MACKIEIEKSINESIDKELPFVEIKGELDRVVIDHEKKLIMPIDFKTTGKTVYSFHYDFLSLRYDFQAATYRQGLLALPKVAELLKEGYVLDDFRYIVVEKSLTNNPMIFVVDYELNKLGLQGGYLANGKFYEGLEQAVDRYKYAVENNAWDYPMEYYENNGLMYLEI